MGQEEERNAGGECDNNNTNSRGRKNTVSRKTATYARACAGDAAGGAEPLQGHAMLHATRHKK